MLKLNIIYRNNHTHINRFIFFLLLLTAGIRSYEQQNQIDSLQPELLKSGRGTNKVKTILRNSNYYSISSNVLNGLYYVNREKS